MMPVLNGDGKDRAFAVSADDYSLNRLQKRKQYQLPEAFPGRSWALPLVLQTIC
jgi:hypothetical protein